jgi:PKD repeat protein
VIEKSRPKEIKPQPVLPNPNSVIIAKPQNGPSPLKVNFSGRKSSSPNGKIVYYSWDFGDGDKSTKPNPVNTYWSTTYGTREFTATLTVTDNKGISSSSSVAIQVVNK